MHSRPARKWDYSYRNDSIGSSRLAFQRGKKPKVTPTEAEKAKCDRDRLQRDRQRPMSSGK